MKELFVKFVASFIFTLVLVAIYVVLSLDTINNVGRIIEVFIAAYAGLTVWYGLRTLFTRKSWNA